MSGAPLRQSERPHSLTKRPALLFGSKRRFCLCKNGVMSSRSAGAPKKMEMTKTSFSEQSNRGERAKKSGYFFLRPPCRGKWRYRTFHRKKWRGKRIFSLIQQKCLFGKLTAFWSYSRRKIRWLPLSVSTTPLIWPTFFGFHQFSERSISSSCFLFSPRNIVSAKQSMVSHPVCVSWLLCFVTIDFLFYFYKTVFRCFFRVTLLTRFIIGPILYFHC